MKINNKKLNFGVSPKIIAAISNMEIALNNNFINNRKAFIDEYSLTAEEAFNTMNLFSKELNKKNMTPEEIVIKSIQDAGESGATFSEILSQPYGSQDNKAHKIVSYILNELIFNGVVELEQNNYELYSLTSEKKRYKSAKKELKARFGMEGKEIDKCFENIKSCTSGQWIELTLLSKSVTLNVIELMIVLERKHIVCAYWERVDNDKVGLLFFKS